jgi:hypothetical protein
MQIDPARHQPQERLLKFLAHDHVWWNTVAALIIKSLEAFSGNNLRFIENFIAFLLKNVNPSG